MLKRFSFLILSITIVLAIGIRANAKSSEIFVNYHFLKGYLELYKGDFKDAASDLWKVFPFVESKGFYQELVDVLVYVGRYREAQHVLEKAVKVYPEDKEFYYKLFDVYTIEDDKKDALRLMKIIQEKFQNTQESLRKIIIMYIKSGKYEDAYKRLKRYIGRYKKDPSGYYLLAQVCLRLKKNSCALKNAKKSVSLAPNQYQYIIFLAGLYEKNGRFLDAIKLYKRLPQSPLVFYVIANDYYMSGDLKDARRFYEKAFLKSGRVDYLERLVYILVGLKDYDTIISYAKKYNKLFQESDRLKLLYGIALSEKNFCKKALEEFSKINPKVDFYNDVIINETQCLCRMGKFDKVRMLLEKVGKLRSYLFVISRFCVHEKKYKEASVLFRDALKFAKNKKEKAVVYFYEADLYYTDLKNRDEAIELLRRAIDLNPKYADALNYLGYLYIDENINVREGMELVERALKIQKDNPYYLDSLGWGYYRLKEYKKAEVYLVKAINGYKSYDRKAKVVSLEHLLEVYKAENLKEKAKNVAHEILKIEPNNRKAKEFLNKK